MTYNASPRRRFTKTQREAFLIEHQSTCYWCGGIIFIGQPWDVEHRVPREMLPDATADNDDNLAPIHAHPAECHKQKSRIDKAAIAKSNRIRRANGPTDGRRKPKKSIQSKPFSKASRPIQSRPFQQKVKQ